MTSIATFQAKLKSELWRQFGDKDHPSEWDGNFLGGGKLSQRYWEYLQAIEMLDLSPDSVLLDIGGGSPVTGAGFFAGLLAPHVKQVHVIDPSVKVQSGSDGNIVYHCQFATRQTLGALFKTYPEITHVACISVFEHIEPAVRDGIICAINEDFQGGTFVATLEYHSKVCHFEHQLTATTLSDLFRPLTFFYADAMERSPVYGSSAYTTALRIFDFKQHTFVFYVGWFLRLLQWYGKPQEVFTPAWYPLAVKFVRVP